jgi:hypothetical protein
MFKAVFDNLRTTYPRNTSWSDHDDVCSTSLAWTRLEKPEGGGLLGPVLRPGLGRTVGANKNPSRSSATRPTNNVQAYSSSTPRSGHVTTSHLRFGRRPSLPTW